MAAGIERALLAVDPLTCNQELVVAFAQDPAAASWLMRTASAAMRPAPTTVADAVAWLAPRLAQEIAAAIESTREPAYAAEYYASSVETRLPMLAVRLADYECRLAGLGGRLERQKLDALKELAYGASHEINNPLANIAARAQTLLEGEVDAERRRKLVAIHRQAIRAHEMIADLMLFARPPKLNPANTSLAILLRQVVDEMLDQARQQGTRLTLNTDGGELILVIDTVQLGVAVRALIANSLEALGKGGDVSVNVRCPTGVPRPVAEISVRDNGPGIPGNVRPHIFDPFFSGREAGRGLGFGLSKCWRIVTDHGGDIMVHCPAEGGAEFSILLPVNSPSSLEPERPPATDSKATSSSSPLPMRESSPGGGSTSSGALV